MEEVSRKVWSAPTDTTTNWASSEWLAQRALIRSFTCTVQAQVSAFVVLFHGSHFPRKLRNKKSYSPEPNTPSRRLLRRAHTVQTRQCQEDASCSAIANNQNLGAKGTVAHPDAEVFKRQEPVARLAGLPHIGVCRVPQTVAHKVKSQHGGNDQNDRNHKPRIVGDRSHILRVLQQHAPAHHRRLESQPEKAQ
jgi:hypothetical protein